jgi:hypothetical protein
MLIGHQSLLIRLVFHLGNKRVLSSKLRVPVFQPSQFLPMPDRCSYNKNCYRAFRVIKDCKDLNDIRK